jgi:hypothetical protein
VPSPRRLVNGVADRIQSWNRSRKAQWLGQFVRDNGARSGLMVGCGGDDQTWENQVERAGAAQLERTVWCGIDARATLPRYVVCDGRALPFRDQSFDLVFSNAVVEHVGHEEEQRRFVAEHARVGISWACTTPNRWFPAESHTRTMLRHWSPAWRSRQAEFTRLLSRRELRRLLPSRSMVIGTIVDPTFIAASTRSGAEPPPGPPLPGEPEVAAPPQVVGEQAKSG